MRTLGCLLVLAAVAGCSSGGQENKSASPDPCFLYVYRVPSSGVIDAVAISSDGVTLAKFGSPPGPPLYENRVTISAGQKSLHFEMIKDGRVVYKADIAMDAQPGGLYSANFSPWPVPSKTAPLKVLSSETPGLSELACWIGPANNRMTDRFKVFLKPGQDLETFKKNAADRGFRVMGYWPGESSVALAPRDGQTLVGGVVECEKWCDEVSAAYIEAHPVD
jgi:hypothetical protein